MMLIIAGGIGFLTWEGYKRIINGILKIPDAKQGGFYGNRNIDILTGSLLFILSFQMCLLQKSMGFFVSIRYAENSRIQYGRFDFSQ